MVIWEATDRDPDGKPDVKDAGNGDGFADESLISRALLDDGGGGGSDMKAAANTTDAQPSVTHKMQGAGRCVYSA